MRSGEVMSQAQREKIARSVSEARKSRALRRQCPACLGKGGLKFAGFSGVHPHVRDVFHCRFCGFEGQWMTSGVPEERDRFLREQVAAFHRTHPAVFAKYTARDMAAWDAYLADLERQGL